MKKIIGIIAFILIFCFLFLLVRKVFWLEQNPITEFYKEPKNSLDIVYVGASNAYNHFNTMLAFNKYGFTTGMMSYNSQPFPATEYLLKEAKKYQNPVLYIIDISQSANNYSEITEAAIRRVTDSMKNSDNRIDAINKLLSYTNVSKEDYINYYYSFFTYHDSWKSPRNIKYNIFGNKDIFKGYRFTKRNTNKYAMDNYYWSDKILPLDEANILVFESLFKYIKENNLNVLFVVSKRFYEEQIQYKLNDAISRIEKNGFDIINFNTLEDFNIDFENDYYNELHMNVYGATKFTLYFAKYLSEHYNLLDHREDKNYETWNKEYIKFQKRFNELTNENFGDLIEKNS